MAATEALIDPAEIMANYEGSGLLDLSNQGLHKLDPKCVCGAAHTLILDQNHIMKLELLEHSQALQQLSVASNRLVRMMAVSKLTNLRVLNLPNNSIGYIEGLKDLLLLQWLNLAGNNIKVIEQLHNCASLQHLDLSDNNISHIGDLTQLSALKTLLLHGNMITSLRTAPAHLPPSLTVLSLAENEIRDLTEVSYLAPLPVLEQLSVMSNPCVMAAPSLPSCDYRPYVVSWCLKLKLLDGQAVSQKEGLKAEWLYSQGKGRAFRPGQHAQLVQYLALTCPLTATPGLQSAEDAKLERVLNKQRQHQRQLQKSRLCCSQSPSRPTHLDVQQWQNHRSREEEEEEEEENKEEDEEQEEEEAIPRKDMDPAVQVNVWLGSGSVVPVLRLPPAAEDGLILEDVDEEKLHGSLLSSDSAYLPFNPAVYPASAPDSGEEEFEDSLAPPTSAQPRLSETESMSGADLAAGGAGKLEVESVGGADFAADGAAGSEAESADGAAGSEAESVARSERLGQVLILSGSESCKWTRSLAVKRCEPHDAAVRIQAWWRGHYTRHCHPQAREVRAEIRLRRMQDHILHLTTELDRVRKQQEEDRLQRRVQEEALKFLWKQAQQFQTERECPAMMACLLQRKREADTLSPSAVKRLRTTDGAFLSPCGRAESVFQEMLEDIGEVLSIESVTVNGCYPDLCDRNPDPGPAQGHSGQGSLTPMFSSFSSSTPMSFFQWQIQQEEQKLMNLSTAELTTRDGDGDTFLHIAVAQGRRALAFVLARKMAAIDMLDMKEHNQQSAFQVSVAADQHLIAQDLLSLGAEINTMDSWGRSPLHVCAEKGHAPTLQAIQKFMQTSGRPVNVEVVNYEGLTPLHVAVLSHNAVVQELECVGTQSPALLQKRKLLSECIGTLLLMGAALNSKDRKSGRSALHMAAEEANIELLRLFLDQPSYFSVVNAKAFNGNTALHMASALQGRQAQLDAVRLLLRRGADPGAKNLENEQPAQLVPEGPLGDQVRRILKGKGAHSRS